MTVPIHSSSLHIPTLLVVGLAALAAFLPSSTSVKDEEVGEVGWHLADQSSRVTFLQRMCILCICYAYVELVCVSIPCGGPRNWIRCMYNASGFHQALPLLSLAL